MQKNTWVFLAVLSVIIAGGIAYRHFAQERDSRGATRLMRALEDNDTEKLEQLLNTEEVNIKDKAGQTPLFYAARNATQPQILHKLLLAGANAFARDKYGNTPLMMAAQYNPHPTITLILARQGGFSQEQTYNKNAALLLAARYNVAPVIKTLLIAHASPSATDDEGHNAANYLANNELLTEQEKTDLRQAMLVLEILEGEKQFIPIPQKEPKLKQMAPSPKPAETPAPNVTLSSTALPKTNETN